MFGISKRGDRYLRTLLIHGARAALGRAEENRIQKPLARQDAGATSPKCRGRSARQQECADRLELARSDTAYDPRLSVQRGLTREAVRDKRKEVPPGNCNDMAGDGETVTPSLPEPGVWTGMASANV